MKEEEGEGARSALNPAIIKTNSTFPAPACLLICVWNNLYSYTAIRWYRPGGGNCYWLELVLLSALPWLLKRHFFRWFHFALDTAWEAVPQTGGKENSWDLCVQQTLLLLFSQGKGIWASGERCSFQKHLPNGKVQIFGVFFSLFLLFFSSFLIKCFLCPTTDFSCCNSSTKHRPFFYPYEGST